MATCLRLFVCRNRRRHRRTTCAYKKRQQQRRRDARNDHGSVEHLDESSDMQILEQLIMNVNFKTVDLEDIGDRKQLKNRSRGRALRPIGF